MVIYDLYGVSELHPPNFNKVSVMPLFETERYDIIFDFFSLFAIIPLSYKNRISNGSVIFTTTGFGTKNLFKLF